MSALPGKPPFPSATAFLCDVLSESSVDHGNVKE